MIILAGSLITLVLGMMNIIMAVMVDLFAEKRSKDITKMAKELEAEEQREKKQLEQIFKKIDLDADGSVTFEELQAGAHRVAAFSHWLRVLDIDRSDLEQLFQIVDEDQSGAIDPMEFVEMMYRLKNTESKTAMRIVKQIVMNLEENQRHQAKQAEIKRLQDDVQQLQGSVDSGVSSLRRHQHGLEVALTDNHGITQLRLQQQEEIIEEAVEKSLQAASDVVMSLSPRSPTLTLEPMTPHEGECRSQDDVSVTLTNMIPETVLPQCAGAEQLMGPKGNCTRQIKIACEVENANLYPCGSPPEVDTESSEVAESAGTGHVLA